MQEIEIGFRRYVLCDEWFLYINFTFRNEPRMNHFAYILRLYWGLLGAVEIFL